MNISKRSILTPVLVSALAMLATAPAKATHPFITKVPMDYTVTFGDCGGFTIVDHIEGFFNVVVVSNKNGDPQLDINTWAAKETFTNTTSNMSFTTTDAGPFIITFHSDGSMTEANIGLISHVVLKGQGEIAAQVGRVVATFDADGNLTGTSFEAGKHDDLLPAICTALA